MYNPFNLKEHDKMVTVTDDYYTFDDVLINPQFSEIDSRKLVSISTTLGAKGTNFNLKLPILSANMDTITGSDMAIAMGKAGGLGVLHRFWSIEANLDALKQVKLAEVEPAASFGLGEYEFKRAISLFEAGCEFLVLDVAHAAQNAVVAQYDAVKRRLGNEAIIVVGNFGNKASITKFTDKLGYKPDIVKVGIGPGSACTTRIKTGVGVPQLTAIIDCVKSDIPVIADGGLKTSGDIAKALAAGAKAVMLGGMLAGTHETPGELFINEETVTNPWFGKAGLPMVVQNNYKVYRGSASKEAYLDQGKDWACAEGLQFTVNYKGPVADVLADIKDGLRSSFSYVGASSLQEFQSKVEFLRVSGNTSRENDAHGKT